MSVPINPETTIGSLLEAYPHLEATLIDLAPAFAKLRNPVIRRTVAKVATLEQAAKIGGISLHTMILELRQAAGASGPDLCAAETSQPDDDAPAWLLHGRIAQEIDAGSLLEHGVHPIGMVREAIGKLGPGEVVVLRSSFRPEPLIETMRRAGAVVHSYAQGGTHFTRFGRTPRQ
jgi:hypothetical protein